MASRDKSYTDGAEFWMKDMKRPVTIYNFLDTKAFVSDRLKQDRRSVQRHSLYLSAGPPSFAFFWVWVKLVSRISSYRKKYGIRKCGNEIQ